MLPIEKNPRAFAVSKLCDGVKSSREIAQMLNEKPKYVQEVMLKYDLPRLRGGAQAGEKNHQYKCGRRIDRDGYVLVTAPSDHPYARQRTNRETKLIYEHRLVMEEKLGRYLLPKEVVDHIDGLRLHNAPENLRHFACNADHLRATISGKVPKWSQAGVEVLSHLNDYRWKKSPRPPTPVDTYLRKKRNGDVRLTQILLALLELGKDSQYLLGTSHHLEKARISDFSHPNLKRELERLYHKYA